MIGSEAALSAGIEAGETRSPDYFFVQSVPEMLSSGVQDLGLCDTLRLIESV